MADEDKMGSAARGIDSLPSTQDFIGRGHDSRVLHEESKAKGLRDEFDKALRSGKSISIEDFLAQRDCTPESDPYLLFLLISSEIEVRTDGLRPTSEDYLERFPGMGLAIRGAYVESCPRGWAIDGYQVEREIGSGGFGKVFLCVKEVGGCKFERAVKVPRFPALATVARLDALKKEKGDQTHRIVNARINHEAIVVPLDRGYDSCGYPFWVYPYVEGGTLRDRILGSPDGLGPAEAVEVAIQVADALVELHKKGIYHCDLKPENIMVDTAGKAKVVDFGLCVADDGRHLRMHVAAGTPYYAPPELLEVGCDIDGRTDVWSLGVILYEMMAGKKPFDAGQNCGMEDWRKFIATTTPSRIAERLGQDTRRLTKLDCIVHECLDMSKDNRPTAASLRKKLHKWNNPYRGVAMGAVVSVLTLTALFFLRYAVPPIPDPVPQPVDSLCIVEKKVLAPTLVSGTKRHADLPSYFWAASQEAENPLLDDAVRQMLGSLDKNDPKRSSSDFRPGIYQRLRAIRSFQENWVRGGRPSEGARGSMTLIYSPAGVGKSAIAAWIPEEIFPPEATINIDFVKDIYYKDNEIPGAWMTRVEPANDLADISGKVVLSKLPRVVRTPERIFPSNLLLSDYINKKINENERYKAGIQAKGAAFLVFDSLDEIHPDDNAILLRQIKAMVEESRSPIVHAVVLGRSESFVDYINSVKGRSGNSIAHQSFELAPPLFTSLGDLTLSNHVHDDFKLHLKWSKDSQGSLGQMSLIDYEEWERAQFSSIGKYSSIVIDRQPVLAERRLLSEWASEYQFISQTLRTLDLKNDLMDIVSDRVSHKQPFNEWEVKSELFDCWLSRGARSHNRPAQGGVGGELLLYIQLLENIAAQHAKVDVKGYFTITSSERVQVESTDGILEFKVEDVLFRSGFISFNPLNRTNSRRVRFEPFFFHAYLIKRHEQRLKGNDPDQLNDCAVCEP